GVRARLSRHHGREPGGSRRGDHGQSPDRSRVHRHRSPDLLPVRDGALARLLGHRRGMIGALAVAVMLAAGVLAPVAAPYSYSSQSLTKRLRPPERAHWLGTDGYGRDVLTRVMWGSRVSLEIGFFATVLSLLVGTLVGGAAGYFGGPVDTGTMRVADVFLAVPSLFLILVVVALFGA